ncbi:MAG: DUF1295 domain-containing protein [Phototrophicaceae bacterium]
MIFLQNYLIGGIAIWVAMTLLWLLSLLIRDASIVDIFWGSGFVIVGWVYFLLSDTITMRHWVLMSLVSIWGLRLSLYLAVRNLGHGEDFRYQKWREEEGQKWWWLSYIRVFMLQGVIMWIVSAPLLGAQQSTTTVSLIDIIAFGIWSIGFFFESIGDWQLMRFKNNPQNEGKVLNTGLWRYTRHPNYFGDAVQWWGFYVFALAVGAWWTIFSPLVMTFFLMRVSGVPMLENSLKKRKPEYAEYIAKTSAFFPMPPKH